MPVLIINPRKTSMFKKISGLILVALGLLWSLQGADLIQIDPLLSLCVANCEPVVGGSVTWLLVGILTLAVGTGLLVWSKRKRDA